MEAAKWECDNCGEKEITLNVHHRRYVKGRMVWEYALSELSVLCEQCHEAHHVDRKFLDDILANIEPGMVEVIAGLAAGYLDAVVAIDNSLARVARETNSMYYELGLVAATVERLGQKEWRKLIADLAAHRPLSPAIAHAMERWNAKK